MSTGVIYQTRKKIITRLNPPLHMIWAGRRYHLIGYMNPLEGMTSSLVGEERVSLEWSYIPRPAVSVILKKIEEKKQKNTSNQIISRKSQKLWRIL